MIHGIKNKNHGITGIKNHINHIKKDKTAKINLIKYGILSLWRKLWKILYSICNLFYFFNNL